MSALPPFPFPFKVFLDLFESQEPEIFSSEEIQTIFPAELDKIGDFAQVIASGFEDAISIAELRKRDPDALEVFEDVIMVRSSRWHSPCSSLRSARPHHLPLQTITCTLTTARPSNYHIHCLPRVPQSNSCTFTVHPANYKHVL